MKILLDECVDQRSGESFPATTSQQYKRLVGRVRRMASRWPSPRAILKPFITVDRNLYFQQDIPKFNIAVLVLSARSNRLADLKPLAATVLAELQRLKRGELSLISK